MKQHLCIGLSIIALTGCSEAQPTPESSMRFYNANVQTRHDDYEFQELQNRCGYTEPEKKELYSAIVNHCETWAGDDPIHLSGRRSGLFNALFGIFQSDKFAKCEVTYDIKPAYGERQTVVTDEYYTKKAGTWLVNPNIAVATELKKVLNVDCDTSYSSSDKSELS